LSGQEWVRALNRIETREDLPITFGGGEPTLHPDFYFIVNELYDRGHKMDLLTNGMFHIDIFMRQVDPGIFKRNSPYASIRVSYHPETMSAEGVLYRVKKMLDRGYHIGIWSVDHPKYKKEISSFSDESRKLGIDFRLKDFLGMYEGKLYGHYKYSGACRGENQKEVICKTSELLIGPDGNVYRCHADLYGNKVPVGHILDDNFQILDIHRLCVSGYGFCSPCDVKIKFDRFQIMGHCSVEIKER
jgi:MoaA/NifB/PqqE/SkfB family radical SAM enzyme